MIRNRSRRVTLLGALADRQRAGHSATFSHPGSHAAPGNRPDPIEVDKGGRRWHRQAEEGPLTEERGESPDPPRPTPRPRPPRPQTRSRHESALRQFTGLDPDDTKRRGESPDPPRPTPRPQPPRPGTRERGESKFRRFASQDAGDLTRERGESPTPPKTKERGESAG